MKIFGTDYDGVIINIEPQKANAFGKLLNKNWQINKDEAFKFWMEKGGTSRRYKFDYFYDKQFGKELSDQDYKIIEAKYSDILENDFYPKTKLLPGAIELLKYVRDNFNFTFVSSGIPMHEIKYLVNLNGLSEYFDLILGTDNLYKSKNDHFQKIIREQKPQLLVFIADAPEDMKLSKKFGAVNIGLSTNHSKGELIKAGATKTCNNLSEAQSIVKGLL